MGALIHRLELDLILPIGVALDEERGLILYLAIIITVLYSKRSSFTYPSPFGFWNELLLICSNKRNESIYILLIIIFRIHCNQSLSIHRQSFDLKSICEDQTSCLGFLLERGSTNKDFVLSSLPAPLEDMVRVPLFASFSPPVLTRLLPFLCINKSIRGTNTAKNSTINYNEGFWGP